MRLIRVTKEAKLRGKNGCADGRWNSGRSVRSVYLVL